MGVYLGIYLEVPYGQTEEIRAVFVDHTTGHEVNWAYNPKTGEPSVPSQKKEIKKINPHPYRLTKVDPELDEEFFTAPEYSAAPKDWKTWIVNIDSKYGNQISDDQECNYSLDNVDSKKLINDFQLEYKNYLDAIEKVFGKYKLFYGIVIYYS